MDLENDANRVLDQLDVLRRPSDLDLLIFFARHPRTLLSTEQLSAFLGYGFKEVASSLELLLAVGFLTRTSNRRHSARMYVFVVPAHDGGWLPGLLRLASTRQGRLALIWAIRRRSINAPGDPVERPARLETDRPEPWPFPGRRAAGREE